MDVQAAAWPAVVRRLCRAVLPYGSERPLVPPDPGIGAARRRSPVPAEDAILSVCHRLATGCTEGVVTSFAKLLTGRSIDLRAIRPASARWP